MFLTVLRNRLSTLLMLWGVFVLAGIALAQGVSSETSKYTEYSSLSPVLHGSDVTLDVNTVLPYTLLKNLPANKELDAYARLKFKLEKGSDGKLKVNLFCEGEAIFDVRAKKFNLNGVAPVDIFDPQYYNWYVTPEPFIPVLVPSPNDPNQPTLPPLYLGDMQATERTGFLDFLAHFYDNTNPGPLPWTSFDGKPGYWDTLVQQLKTACLLIKYFTGT